LVEKSLGKAKVLALFKVSKGGTAAGCRVINGEIRRNSHARVLRDGKEVVVSEISNIKREKDDVREVREGMECGITVKNFEDFAIGDVIESFTMEKFGA
jgi:translation initiation factor IF-2